MANNLSKDSALINWEEVYKKESAFLFGYLLKKTGENMALDILQETFLKVFSKKQKKISITNIRAYLFQTARNIFYDKNKEDQRMNPEIEPINPLEKSSEEKYLEEEIISLLDQAVKSLPQEQKEIIEFRFHHGLSSGEIAIIMDKSQRHIRRLLRYSKQSLVRFFRSQGWEDFHGI